MAAPPDYNQGQFNNHQQGQGGFNEPPPPYGNNQQGSSGFSNLASEADRAAQGLANELNKVTSSANKEASRYVATTNQSLGTQPVTTNCPNCHANITTIPTEENGVLAWGLAAALCVVGAWCCAPIPIFFTDKWKDVTHRCPNCGAIVGKYRAQL